MSEITEGVCGDGVCFLENGVRLSVDEIKGRLQQLSRTQARLEEAESKLNKALDAMDYLHSTCCSIITNATDCVSHFEVSGNSMNALDDVVKSEEVQRILNIRLLDLRPKKQNTDKE